MGSRDDADSIHHHHHHHGHHHKGKQIALANASMNSSAKVSVLREMKKLETAIATAAKKTKLGRGELEMNGPLPADFSDRFAKEVAKATGGKPEDVKVLNTSQVKGETGIDEIVFEAPPDIIKAVEEQAADPDSKLATGPLRIFLIEKADDEGDEDAKKADEKD